MSKIKIGAAGLIAATVVAVLSAAMPAPGLATVAPPQEALPMAWVVGYMARKSSGDLVDLRYQDGAYQAKLRHGDGRIAQVEVDRVTARIRAMDGTDLFRNSIDLPRVQAAATPAQGLQAHQVVQRLMATGQYRRLLGLTLEASGWRVALEDNDGRRREVTVDPLDGGHVTTTL